MIQYIGEREGDGKGMEGGMKGKWEGEIEGGGWRGMRRVFYAHHEDTLSVVVWSVTHVITLHHKIQA